MINDETIKSTFLNVSGFVNSNLLKKTWLDSHDEIRNYLAERYVDSTGFNETVHRIIHGIETRPTCPVCGGPVTFDPSHVKKRGTIFATYCSKDCMKKSDEYKINQRNGILKRNENLEENVHHGTAFYHETYDRELRIDIPENAAMREYEIIMKSPGRLDAIPNKNKCVLLFQEDNFYRREKKLFKEDERLRCFILENRSKYLGKDIRDLTVSEIIRGFKISGKLVSYSHFSPLWTKYFAEQNNVKVVAYPFGGWGHHLVGFAAAGCKIYYNDIVENTVNAVRKISDFIHADSVITCSNAITWDIPDDCDAVFMCPPYYNVEEYECGKFEQISDYDNLMNTVIENIMKSNATTLGVIIRSDFEYIFDPIIKFLISKEEVNTAKSHFSKNGKKLEYLYTFKIK